MVTLRSWKFLSIATFAVGLSACSVFDPDMGSGPSTPENNTQTIGDEQEGLTCKATLAVKGVKRPSGQMPDMEEAEAGCVPLGTWQLEVAVQDAGGCADLNVPAVYTYEVSLDTDGQYQVKWLEDPANTQVQLRVGQEGPGMCKGSFEHRSADGKVSITLKPFEQDNGITGQGDVRISQ